MSIDTVRQYLKQWNRDKDIIEFDCSSATVELASKALDVEPARIAKTISFKSNDFPAILIVTAGDTKIDNSKFKKEFGLKAKMLNPDEVLEITGYNIGGVCPFSVKNDLPVYMDISLKRFNTVFPACGSSNSAIELTCEDLYNYSKCIKYIDVCKLN